MATLYVPIARYAAHDNPWAAVKGGGRKPGQIAVVGKPHRARGAAAREAFAIADHNETRRKRGGVYADQPPFDMSLWVVTEEVKLQA